MTPYPQILFFKFNWGVIEIHHCINLKYSVWFDLHPSWNDYHSKYTEHPSSHRDTKIKKREKMFFLMTRTCRTYTAMFIILITLFVTSVVFIYLITGSVYVLTTFIQDPPLPPRLWPGLLNRDLCGWHSEIWLFSKHWLPPAWSLRRSFGTIENAEMGKAWADREFRFRHQRGHFQLCSFKLLRMEEQLKFGRADVECEWGWHAHWRAPWCCAYTRLTSTAIA